MSTTLDEFYHNFPLIFIGRDLSKQQVSNFSSSINDVRDQILQKTWNFANTKKPDPAYCTNQLYLYATGNFSYETKSDDDPCQTVRSLKNTHQISESSCGFVSDIDITQRREIIKINTNSDLNDASFHEIFRFCFSHGMYIGHDIDIEELKSMARWIIRNENDGVTFSHFSTLMQQAIDMSVLAQYAADIGPESDSESRERLNQLSDQALSITIDMENQSSYSLHEAGLLLSAANEISERKPISEFQSKVLHLHTESQMQIEEKIEKGSQLHTHSNSSNQTSQNNSQNQEENSNDN